MVKGKAIVIVLSVLLVLTVFANPGFSATSITPSDYPSLSEKEMGHLRWIVKLANQPPGDWSYMGGLEAGQEWLEAYRYQLAFMTYALALAQYHKTPAYREVYQTAIDQLIRKMVRQDVWSFWVESSKGGKKMNPALKEKAAGWIDPVADKNIMYSGHLIHMVELYRMLYGDKKYDNPASLVFSWQWLMEELNKFEYNSPKLAQLIHDQFERNSSHAIECEVNMIFTQCNQHPILGLMLYDANHGTKLASVRDEFRKSLFEKKLFNPDTHNFVNFYMVQQDKPIPTVSPGQDGWTGAFMHAWDPKFIEEQYPFQAQVHVKWQSDGTAAVPDKTWGSNGAAFFALLAKEVGDEKTAKGILSWIDKNYAPVWTDGMFRYPRNDAQKVTPLFTNLAAAAEVNVKNGIFDLHNRPWTDAHFSQPFISNVDYPRALVKQAYYDGSKDLLLITLVPGGKALQTTTFAVGRLDASKTYLILKNGKLAGYIKKGSVQSKKGVKELQSKGGGEFGISTELKGPVTFVIKAEG